MHVFGVQCPLLCGHIRIVLLVFLRIEFGIPHRKQIDVDPIHCINLGGHVNVHFVSFLLSRQEAVQPNDPGPVLIAVYLQHRLLKLLHLVLVDEGLFIVVILSASWRPD